MSRLSPAIEQFLRFVVVGCVATGGHYCVLIVLSEGFAAEPVPASAAGFAVGAVISYALNYLHVFKSDQKHLPTFGRFMAVALTGLVMNSLVVWLAAEVTGLHYLVSQIVATVLVMGWSYTANRYWTFAAAPG